MAFWGGRKLLNELSGSPIITPFDPDLIDCNAYTLRMGAEYYVTPDAGTLLRRSKGVLKEPTALNTPFGIFDRRGGNLVIPTGQFAFLLTEEIVNMPKNVMGFISLKSATKFRGLINVSGFHVDPGYTGNLIYSVFNAGPADIHIQRHDRLFLLWLADLAGPAERKFYKSMPIPQLEIPSRLVSDVAREVPSIQRVSERLESVERRVGLIYWGAAFLVGLVTIVTAIAGVYFGYVSIGGKEPDQGRVQVERKR